MLTFVVLAGLDLWCTREHPALEAAPYNRSKQWTQRLAWWSIQQHVALLEDVLTGGFGPG